MSSSVALHLFCLFMSLADLEPAIWLGRTGQQFLNLPVLDGERTGIPGIYIRTGDLNSGLHAYSANPLYTEPSPQAQEGTC